MVHTLPPWTSKWRMATIFGQIDQSELAVRLGSIVTHDRRGNVVWMDDFEDGLQKWGTGSSGTGGGAASSANAARNGAKSVALTAGSTASLNAYIDKGFQFPVLGKVGIEFSYTNPPDFSKIYLSVQVDDAAVLYKAGLRFESDDNKLDFLNSAGNWESTEEGYAMFQSNQMWYTMKLVLDLSSYQYARAIWGDTAIDLSGEGMHINATTTTKICYVYIEFTGTALANPVLYLDDFILTQNEP